MTQVLDIAAVARSTGLTARALRFYEARGLIRPLRSASGRRLFGPEEIERLHAIVTLKRAGFGLAAIGAMLGGPRRMALAPLVAAQLAELERRAAEIAEMQALLGQVQSRIDRGEPIDVATLCSLIRKGNEMSEDKWHAVTDRYFSEAEKTEFAATLPQVPADFDADAYAAQWRDLGSRIAAAQPMDPASEAAGGFVREWVALLEPFLRVATPGMKEGVGRFYQKMPEWEGELDPGFSAATFAFVQEAAKAHGIALTAGGQGSSSMSQ